MLFSAALMLFSVVVSLCVGEALLRINVSMTTYDVEMCSLQSVPKPIHPYLSVVVTRNDDHGGDP